MDSSFCILEYRSKNLVASQSDSVAGDRPGDAEKAASLATKGGKIDRRRSVTAIKQSHPARAEIEIVTSDNSDYRKSYGFSAITNNDSSVRLILRPARKSTPAAYKLIRLAGQSRCIAFE
jgi:hypothetical protein